MAEFLQIPTPRFALRRLFRLCSITARCSSRPTRSRPFRTLTHSKEKIPPTMPVLKNGWFFSAPFMVLIVGIFWLNYAVEACALYAASIVVVLSLIFGYKGKRLPMKGIIEVLRATGTRVLQIYMIGAAAGIVIGVLNISGLGFGLTISLIHAAGGSLILLLVLAAAVCIILEWECPPRRLYPRRHAGGACADSDEDCPMAAHLFLLFTGYCRRSRHP